MNNGFVRVAAAIPELRVADCAYNVARMADLIRKGDEEKVQVICFPELSITGYTCADLFQQQKLLIDAQKALNELQLLTFTTTSVIIAGMPVKIQSHIFNAAVVLQGGHVLGVVPKTHLPNNNEFYEKRWFTSGVLADSQTITLSGEQVPFGTDILFSDGKFTFGIEICEDLWVPIPPSSQQALHGAEIIFNLSATNELIGKHQYLRQLIEQQSARCNAGYVYASAGAGESTTDVVYSGNGLIAENGKMIATSERFSFDPQLIVTDIDIERLQAERIRNTNYANDKSAVPYRTIQLEDAHFIHFDLKRTFDRHPAHPIRYPCNWYFRWTGFHIGIVGERKNCRQTGSQQKTDYRDYHARLWNYRPHLY